MAGPQQAMNSQLASHIAQQGAGGKGQTGFTTPDLLLKSSPEGVWFRNYTVGLEKTKGVLHEAMSQSANLRGRTHPVIDSMFSIFASRQEAFTSDLASSDAQDTSQSAGGGGETFSPDASPVSHRSGHASNDADNQSGGGDAPPDPPPAFPTTGDAVRSPGAAMHAMVEQASAGQGVDVNNKELGTFSPTATPGQNKGQAVGQSLSS